MTAQLGIACLCDTDHGGAHYVRQFTTVATDGDALAGLFATSAQRAVALIAGPTDPGYWRPVADLP